MSELEGRSALEFVRDALKAARGAVASSLREGGREYTGKRGYFGDATLKVDAAAEDAVVELAREALRDPFIVTEEGGISEGEGPLVLLDPVDGSTNARRGLPSFSTAIAVARAGGRRYADILAAGVLDHSTGEVYWGDRNGVYVGWMPTSPSDVASVEEGVVGFNSQTISMGPEEEGIVRLLRRVKYPRMLGSAALEIAHVAAGRSDAFVAHYAGLRTFDCLPSIFLLETAGGMIAALGFDLDGFRLDSKERLRFVVAANERIMDELLDVLELRGRADLVVRGRGRTSGTS